MTRVSERLQDRQERASTDLAERIRQSEERTARLLEDARERIDSRLAETQRRPIEPPPAPSPSAAFADPGGVAPFGQDSFSTAPLPDDRYTARPWARPPSPRLREPDLLTPRGFVEPSFGEPSLRRAPIGDARPFAEKAAIR